MSTDLAMNILSPYTRNCNTGNNYEIQVVFFLLRALGLTNERLDALAPLITSIKACNSRYSIPAYIDRIVASMRSSPSPVSAVANLDGHTMIDIRNTTQDDDDGKTADLIVTTATGAEFGISVSGGKPSRSGRIDKCLTNPSAKRLGATAADIEAIKALQATAIAEFKTYMTATYGPDETAWPERQKTSAAITAATGAARIVADRFATLPAEQQIAIFCDLLRIDDVSTMPADYLALAIPGTATKPLACKFYKFGEPIFTRWEPRVIADGVWLHLYNCDAVVGKIQVKFNNGVYHKGKTSDLHSSWNFTVNLRDIFQLKEVTLR